MEYLRDHIVEQKLCVVARKKLNGKGRTQEMGDGGFAKQFVIFLMYGSSITL